MGTVGPRGRLALALLVVGAATMCAGGLAEAQLTIGFEPVATGLSSPLGLVHAGDGSGRLFIVEQTGRIRIHDGTQVRPTAFLDVSTLIVCCGERGLLGLAFHPDYATNGLFYVHYTNTAGNTAIARYRVSPDPNVADAASGQVLLNVTQPPFTNHKGGQLAFGPDGYLYIGLGDGGSGGDPDNRAQNLGTLLGKILRIDVDGGAPYAIPPTNPFRNRPGALPEIWAYGLRNPWRFSFDRQTGDLFIADVGQSAREEVNFQPSTSLGGENYGWRRMEGTICFNPSSGCNDGTLTLPILDYDHSLGCSITGGYRYRGGRFPQFAGRFFYGDFCSGRIWTATQSGQTWSTTQLIDTALSITSFGEDEAGELYVVHYGSGSDGTVQRVVELAQSFALTVSRTGTGTGAVVSAPTGISCGSACSQPFGVGATVTLTATAAAGSVFAGWSGACAGTGTCTLTMDAAKSVTASFTTGAIRGDLNGDGKADILWRNGSGDVALFLMDGLSLVNSRLIGTVNPAWSVAGLGDFNGDGKVDILWRNASTGDNAIFLMDGFTIASSRVIGNINPAWSVVGIGDFNGDGKADILWRNASTGDNAIFLMDGFTTTSSRLIGPVSGAWRVVGIGDFNGDGKADILWRNASTGDNAIFLMDGFTTTGSRVIGNINPAWSVVGIGDFNGDGKADILWRNGATGDNAIFLMDGFTITSSRLIDSINPAWSVVGVRDFNGDGKADILWRNTSTGENAVLVMVGFTVTRSGLIPPVPTDWIAIDK